MSIGLVKKLKVGPYTYPVKLVKNLTHKGEEQKGLFDSYTGIEIDDSMPEDMQAEVLLHELLHSIFFMMNVEKIQGTSALEEIFVTQFGTGLATVFKNNPELLTYFKKALK